MSTPVAHLLAGASCGVIVDVSDSLRKRALAGGALGVSADLDFVPGLLVGEPARFHHAATHSIGFALLVALLAAAIVGSGRARWALLAVSAYGSHLLLDLLTVDPSPPRGIPLLWPATVDAFQAPVALLPRVLHASHGVINLHNLLLATAELVAFGGLLLVLLWVRRSSNGAGGPGAGGGEPPPATSRRPRSGG